MKKSFLLGILFFSTLWGASEGILGGYLYGMHMPYTSVSLTIIAFMILTVAKIYLPQKGSATLIGAIAMLYKFLNTPFFACHLLAIFLLGASYDLVFHLAKIKSKALFGVLATYLGYILFALTITYVFRYRYWIDEGLPRILRYIGTSGSMAALGNLLAVPLSFRIGQQIKKSTANPFTFTSRLSTASVTLVTLALWIVAIGKWL